ncbi:MAG: rhodanese-like domain-containing protein [Nitrospiraceae bacterium]|nr:MAG: rhodanese-like domain-containing protein [Nitrospiraceae bacterium]
MRSRIILITGMAAIFMLFSCAARTVKEGPELVQRFEDLADECRRMYPHVSWMTLQEFSARQDRAEWVILDSRSPMEREVSFIPGSVFADDFETVVSRHEGRNVLVYCTVGCRSGEYAERLQQRGLKAFVLWGGVLAWALDNRPFMSPEGEPTRKVHVFGSRWNALPESYGAVW